MNPDLATATTGTIADRLLLKETFAYETPTSLEDCVQKLSHLHSDKPSDWNEVGRRSRYRVEVPQTDNDRRHFTVTRLTRPRAYDSRISSTSRTLEVSGILTSNPQTGGTHVTGEIQLPPLMVASFGVVVLVLLSMAVSGRMPPYIALIVFGIFAYLVYGIIRDRSDLLRRLQAL